MEFNSIRHDISDTFEIFANSELTEEMKIEQALSWEDIAIDIIAATPTNAENLQSYPIIQLQSYVIPQDILNNIFKECGPFVLTLPSISIAFQQNLQINHDFQTQKKALELLKNSYQLFANIDKCLKDEKVLVRIVSALTLIDSEQALKIASSLKVGKYSSLKYRALMAIAKTLITKDPQKALKVLDLAIEAVPTGYGSEQYTAHLKPIIKILASLDPEKALKIGYIEINKKDDVIDFLRKTAHLSKALIATHPQKALEMLDEALKRLKKYPNLEWEFVPLFKILAQIVPERALKATITLNDKYKTYVLAAVIKSLAPSERALEIAASTPLEGYDKPRCLAELAVALSFLSDKKRASEVCDLAIASAPHAQDLISVAGILAKTNPEKSLEASIKAYDWTIAGLESHKRWDYLESIAAIIPKLNLSDRKLMIVLLEKMFTLSSSYPERVNGGVSSPGCVRSAVAVALAPFNLRRALKIVDTIEEPSLLAETRAKIAGRLFTGT